MGRNDRNQTAEIKAQKPDTPVMITRIGNTTVRIGLHFSEKKKQTADDIFHRLVAEKAKIDGIE